MNATIELNELPTGVITVQIPFRVADRGESWRDSRYDWKAETPVTDPEEDEPAIEIEADRYFATIDEAVADLYKRFGVQR